MASATKMERKSQPLHVRHQTENNSWVSRATLLRVSWVSKLLHCCCQHLQGALGLGLLCLVSYCDSASSSFSSLHSSPLYILPEKFHREFSFCFVLKGKSSLASLLYPQYDVQTFISQFIVYEEKELRGIKASMGLGSRHTTSSTPTTQSDWFGVVCPDSTNTCQRPSMPAIASWHPPDWTVIGPLRSSVGFSTFSGQHRRRNLSNLPFD